MTQDELKRMVGQAAVAWVQPGTVIGVGTGTTVNHFIDALANGPRVAGAVSSSLQSSARLRGHGIAVLDASEVTSLDVYVDGADEIDAAGCMIKGGGAALTREKIVADLAQRFVCIVDASKRVDVLGQFPLPVEVIAMAVNQVVRRFAALGGAATVRAGVLTDNGHPVVDVRGLRITDPLALEAEIDQWPGVVTVGIFARQRADVCLLGAESGVETIRYAPRTSP
ncbi:MAG TPA: ribose-5-phosphate isomerase RpiA [Burkholderiaceae bacterium]|nr:ribose-5-phosphate isomerase RpiA [Burkholderiaceae bacterium]